MVTYNLQDSRRLQDIAQERNPPSVPRERTTECEKLIVVDNTEQGRIAGCASVVRVERDCIPDTRRAGVEMCTPWGGWVPPHTLVDHVHV